MRETTTQTTRNRYERRGGRLTLAVLASLFTVGCAAAAADAPTSPMAGASLKADEVPLTICTDDCVFEGRGRNEGLGCAAKITGTTKVSSREGRVLAQVDWTLNPNWIVRPGETFLYDGCCFDKSLMLQTVSYATELSWTDVSCSQS